MKSLTIYLAFIILSEIIGHVFEHLKYDMLNKEYYTYIVIPIEYLFFFWLYSTQAIKQWEKWGIKFLSFTYLVLLIFEFTQRNQGAFLSISYMFGSLFLLIIVFNFLYNFIKHSDIINFNTNPIIYISIGLLIFYIGSFPFYGLKNYLWTNYRLIGNNYWYVATALNCIMYCMFTISFLCSKQKSI